MGLPISRETLSRIGFRLTLDPASGYQGAVFRISPEESKDIPRRQSNDR